MSYITREDGEHFVVPSYRDVLAAKQKNALKKEIVALSQNYGEYITLQPKNTSQYEVAFSPDAGYLLGETVWHVFQKPAEMIYCEAIPGTNEALLVIVKAGSVYLDGSFSLDSIPEELIIFLTQQNQFEIHIYGAVPISQTPEEGKFSFEASSVKSFTVLSEPVFPTLPLLKNYRLQLVEQVLRAQGIGVFPIVNLIGILALAGMAYLVWSYWSQSAPPPPPPEAEQINPYQAFLDNLTSPDPEMELKEVILLLAELNTLPGWHPKELDYASGSLNAALMSGGGTVAALQSWANRNHLTVNIQGKGISMSGSEEKIPRRAQPTVIYPVKQTVGYLIDAFAKIYPGNLISGLGESKAIGSAKQLSVTLTFTQASPVLLTLVGKKLQGMPIVLRETKLKMENGKISGTITMDILGN